MLVNMSIARSNLSLCDKFSLLPGFWWKDMDVMLCYAMMLKTKSFEGKWKCLQQSISLFFLMGKFSKLSFFHINHARILVYQRDWKLALCIGFGICIQTEGMSFCGSVQLICGFWGILRGVNLQYFSLYIERFQYYTYNILPYLLTYWYKL